MPSAPRQTTTCSGYLRQVNIPVTENYCPPFLDWTDQPSQWTHSPESESEPGDPKIPSGTPVRQRRSRSRNTENYCPPFLVHLKRYMSVAAQIVLGGVLGGNLASYTMITSTAC